MIFKLMKLRRNVIKAMRRIQDRSTAIDRDKYQRTMGENKKF